MSQGAFRITKDSVGWGLVCLWHLQKECTSLLSALLNICAVSIKQMLQRLCVSSFSSGSGHFSCEVVGCPPVPHAAILQVIAAGASGDKLQRNTCNLLSFVLFFFVAWKWKAISSLSLNLREAHYEHLARDCKNIWMLREKSKNEHGFSVARSYFQCVKYHKYFPFSYLLPLL